MPHSNSSSTSEVPARERERSEDSPETMESCFSSGTVTNCSTSSGALPGNPVRTVRVGWEKRGIRASCSRA